MSGTDQEFVSEEPSDAADAVGKEALHRLREKLKRAVEEKQEYLEGWQRARADFANYKREEASLHADKEARIKARFVEEVLPALDALELATRHESDETLAMLQRQFDASLRKLGVERFGAKGEEFDPTMHEALAKNGEDHVVQSVERSGYKIGDYVVRPAQVTI